MKQSLALRQSLARSADPRAIFALLNLGMVQALTSGALGATDAVRWFYNAENCLFVRKQLKSKTADAVMSHGVQLPDLFDCLSPAEAQRQFTRELEEIRQLCLKLLAPGRLSARATG
jgi:hypothetical protein